MDIKNFKPRLYQETISNTCLKKNTLIVLPTGIGKTKCAILTTIKRLKTHENSKVLFLTPTKPLAAQIQKEFQESTDIEKEKILLFTGEIQPNKRKELAKNAIIIVGTPQTISNDIINNHLNLEDISILILDEAHRNVKDYAYTWIAKQYNKKARYPRIIGLTASPGSDIETISSICKNAFIEEIEQRSDQDPDVKPYVQELEIEWEKLELSKEYKEILEYLNKCYKEKLLFLKNSNIMGKLDLSKKELIGLMGSLQGKIARGEKDFRILKSVSFIAQALKVQHAIELIETQGHQPLYKYMTNIYKEAEKTKVKATKNLVKDLNFHSAYTKARNLQEKEIEHPKLTKLKEILKKELKKNPNLRTIVFNQYRDSAKIVEKELNKLENINSKLFVGQQKKEGTGLTQKEQIKIIEDFKNGIYNILVSSSVGEEGLDIPSVNLVIFFEPVPSAIRAIQRRGRTARVQKGKTIILMTKNTRDEAYHWVSYHKERNMKKILNNVNKKIKTEKIQPMLTDFDDTAITIYIDSREGKNNVTKELINQGVKVKTKNLEVADYIISDKIGIERKEVRDFVNSIIDKRLFQQLRNLRENFEKALIIIEGIEDIYSIRKIHPNAIRGMLSTIAITYNIPILYTKNQTDTASLIRIIAKREQEGKNNNYLIRVERKPLSTQDQQRFIIESLPGIGPIISKALLKKFKTVKKIINAKEKDLKEVENLGDKKAKEIKKILEEEY